MSPAHTIGPGDCRATRSPATTAEVLGSLARVLIDGGDPALDLELDGSRDEYLRLLSAIVQLRDDDDHPRQIRNLSKALQARDRELVLASAAIEHGGIGLSVFRHDGRYVSVNSETCRRTGYSPEEYATMHIWDTSPAFTPDVLDRMWEQHDHAEPLRLNTEVIARDGSRIPVDVMVRVIDFQGEKIICALSIDVSERKRTEQALRESEQRFSHAFHGNPVSMAILNGGGFYLEVNHAWETHCGYPAGDVLGKHMSEVPLWEDVNAMLDAAEELLREGRISAFETQFATRSGDRRVGRVTVEPLEIEGSACILMAVEDTTEQRRAQAEREASMMRLEALTQQTIGAMARLVEARDPYTAGHEERVTQLAVGIAGKLGLDPQTTAGVKVAAQLHDLGKMTVPAEILAKPGSLSTAEFSLVKQHAEAGARMLADIDFPWPVAETIAQHHERLDGSGYPMGLSADEILPQARIIAVADVVEAMSAHRPYRPSLGIDSAFAEIERGRGRIYDAAAVDACLELFREDGFSFK